jgi:Zn-dependent protease
MDFFSQGIPIGRVFRITVILHWTFLLYAANELFHKDPNTELGYLVLYLVLLFGTILLHEFGHALSCKAVGGEATHIVLWPLGGLAFVSPPMNPWAALITTACGPLVNAILWPLFWAIWHFGVTRAMLHGELGVAMQYLGFTCYIMMSINKLLLLFNLIPAYPMDGGRLLQEILWIFVGYGRSLLIAGMVGTVAGGGLLVLGLGLRSIELPGIGALGGSPDMNLIIIGLLSMMASWGIYHRSKEIKSWRKN